MKDNSNDGSVCQGTPGRFLMTEVVTGFLGLGDARAFHYLVSFAVGV